MRVGILCKGETADVEWASKLSFRSMAWMRFALSPCAPEHADWKHFAEELSAAAKRHDIRISAIGALYANPLDPRQTERARAVFHRAIEVAASLGVKTVSGFAGGVIETTLNERGGNPVYRPFEDFIPQILAFWEPIAAFAADHGVRIAFENCPQAPLPLPVMGYNCMARPATWEKIFNATQYSNIGLEWDPSHLICQLIDPVENLRLFGSRVFHVHAKDAFINQSLLERYGICHPGVAEHRVPGLGQADWPQIIHTLARVGYDSDINIEGWHDPVFRDHQAGTAVTNPLAGRKMEESGLLIAKRLLDSLTKSC